MQGKKLHNLFRESFLGLPIAAQYVVSWRVLTGLDWYDVFAHLPLELDVDDDSLAMEQLVPSAFVDKTLQIY